jgi:Spy/CpxP family protein refolding chaperone
MAVRRLGLQKTHYIKVAVSAVAKIIVGVAVALLSLAARAAAMAPADKASNDIEAAYTKSISARADKIVGALDFNDADKKARIHELITAQYRALRNIHDTRDSKLNQAASTPGSDRTIAEAWNKVARDTADLQLLEAHRRFVARLSVELTPEQVETVKDGLTYNVVRITYDRYLELLPTLNHEQRREILANLVEAREYAIDAGSSEEKHAIFGKFKGRINNYLSSQGFDLKAAEKERLARPKAAAPNDSR